MILSHFCGLSKNLTGPQKSYWTSKISTSWFCHTIVKTQNNYTGPQNMLTLSWFCHTFVVSQKIMLDLKYFDIFMIWSHFCENSKQLYRASKYLDIVLLLSNFCGKSKNYVGDLVFQHYHDFVTLLWKLKTIILGIKIFWHCHDYVTLLWQVKKHIILILNVFNILTMLWFCGTFVVA